MQRQLLPPRCRDGPRLPPRCQTAISFTRQAHCCRITRGARCDSAHESSRRTDLASLISPPTEVALIKHAHESGNEAGTVMAAPNCFGPQCLCLAHISVYSLDSGPTADQESDGPSRSDSSHILASFCAEYWILKGPCNGHVQTSDT